MSTISSRTREGRTTEFLSRVERYADAAEGERATLAQEIRALRLGNCTDDLPKALSERLAATGVEGRAFCGYQGTEGVFTVRQAVRLITRWHA